MSLRLTLHLPRDAGTVTMARRLLDQALGTLRVAEDCRGELALILTEACANVVQHAAGSQAYEISVCVSHDECVIEVINTGPVVDPSIWIDRGEAPATAEGGRGLRLIMSLADEVTLDPDDGGGVALRAVKKLAWCQEPAS
ncbi:ATP-binding protein [Actinoplanes utahensis]|uniref:Histidine kinase/HSP90-like ATPase domain-containing protein n=1 Tax=Actinoplanes utahensis TaxID=1869 RepID=A0A0A6US68_ACTUT|nr:ATP-binding protein [Actinoplanes utahensis]KHD77284.1 hypothetical protein MB27_12215 [Actinoplanes utahensis]